MSMSYQQIDSEALVLLEPSVKAVATVIWLHGLGADGFDFVPIVPELQLPDTLGVRFIFPHARPRPVTINGGYVMRAWYDIRGISAGAVEDREGIRESEAVVRDLIEREIAAGIPAQRIVIAGFSQGGAIALQTALRYSQALGGVMALSTYLPLRDLVATEATPANRRIPILMCHGSQDTVVPPAMGEASRDVLVKLGYDVDWRTYPMPHSVHPAQIADISQWLVKRFTV